MKVITCFSYKGGAGRTTAAANIAAALASVREVRDASGNVRAPLRNKVALMDLDVFSAGVHRVFQISNNEINRHTPCVEDYLRDQMAPHAYVEKGGIRLTSALMDQFRLKSGADDYCEKSFTLFPSRADPRTKFVVQKQHENVLIELLIELESARHGFDYVILDGESGTRSMADIALRLADVILVFFRLTWQHIDGSLNTAQEWEKTTEKPFYLIPTCVPLVQGDENVYRDSAPGLRELAQLTERVPEDSLLNEFAASHRNTAGHFWSGAAEHSSDTNGSALREQRVCVHDSLFLKGEERVIAFHPDMRNDRAAKDYYRIASEINRLHPPE